MSAPIRVAMLARVVYPLHGYGGIERHVYHLTTHLARLGVDITLYVQQSDDIAGLAHLRTQMRVETMRYDYTSPFLRPNSILGRQLNYPRYTRAQGALVGQRVASGAYDIVHTQGLCAYGYAVARAADARLRAVPFLRIRTASKNTERRIGANGWPTSRSARCTATAIARQITPSPPMPVLRPICRSIWASMQPRSSLSPVRLIVAKT